MHNGLMGPMREWFRGDHSPAPLRLSPHAEREKKAQRIGHHKYIGGPYKILGKKPPGEEFCRWRPSLTGMLNV